jgi:hypothetical protein
MGACIFGQQVGTAYSPSGHSLPTPVALTSAPSGLHYPGMDTHTGAYTPPHAYNRPTVGSDGNRPASPASPAKSTGGLPSAPTARWRAA